MALCLTIAARPAWIERVAKTPLDRLYVHHRQLGWATLALVFLHYFVKDLAAPFYSWMGVGEAARGRSAADPNLWAQLWQGAKTAAVTSAEWLIWIMAAACVLAAVRALNHRRWFTIHRVLSVVFLLLVLHVVRLTDPADWATPFGVAIALTTLLGAWASVKLLVSGAGADVRTEGRIEKVERAETLTLITVATPVARSVRPGQFVFLSARGEPPHPFSVSGVGQDRITLAIKKLGDFTGDLVPALEAGEAVRIEGPWGDFTPVFDDEPQTWVAGGVGIAPFVMWLKAAREAKHGPLTLCWCVRDRAAEPMLPEVESLARAAGVTLKVFESRIARASPTELLADRPQRIAFCGPAKLMAALRAQWRGPAERFQAEVFSWRHAG